MIFVKSRTTEIRFGDKQNNKNVKASLSYYQTHFHAAIMLYVICKSSISEIVFKMIKKMYLPSVGMQFHKPLQTEKSLGMSVEID